MRTKVDEGLPKAIMQMLREHGHDVVGSRSTTSPPSVRQPTVVWLATASHTTPEKPEKLQH